jgi:hypothetical protein
MMPVAQVFKVPVDMIHVRVSPEEAIPILVSTLSIGAYQHTHERG